MDNIRKVFSGAFGFVYHYRKAIIKANSVPFTIIVLLAVMEIVWDVNGLWAILGELLGVLFHTVLAVTTHRIILLGETSVPEWGFRKLSMREIRFFFSGLGVGLLMFPPAFLFTVPVVGFPLALIAVSYVLGRFSLVFPAIATDQNWSFQDSWVKTKDHQLMMVITVLVFPSVVAFPVYLLATLPYSEIPTVLVSSFTAIFVVAALSVAYKLIRGDNLFQQAG